MGRCERAQLLGKDGIRNTSDLAKPITKLTYVAKHHQGITNQARLPRAQHIKQDACKDSELESCMTR